MGVSKELLLAAVISLPGFVLPVGGVLGAFLGTLLDLRSAGRDAKLRPVAKGVDSDPFRRFARRLTRAFALLLAIAGAFGIAGYVATSGAAEGRLYERAENAPRRRVAIVLGALVFRDGRLSDVVEDRVRCAVELFGARRVDRVLVSGDHGRESYDEVSAMGAALVEAGVPASRVFLDHAGAARLLGPSVPIEGDGRATHDRPL